MTLPCTCCACLGKSCIKLEGLSCCSECVKATNCHCEMSEASFSDAKWRCLVRAQQKLEDDEERANEEMVRPLMILPILIGCWRSYLLHLLPFGMALTCPPVIFLHLLVAILQVGNRFPSVFWDIVSLPFNQIKWLSVDLFVIQDLFNFIFIILAFDFDMFCCCGVLGCRFQ